MKVCMVVYNIYECDNRVLRYAETLAKRGDHVDVISVSKGEQTREGVVNGVHVCRVQKRDHKEKHKFAYLSNILLFWWRAMLVLTGRHLRNRYDVIHVHSVPDFLVFVAWLPKLTGGKIILDIHDLLPEFYGSKFHNGDDSLICRVLRLVERVSIAFSDHVIISNDLWKEKLLARSVKNGKCLVVLNLPDFSVFHPRGRTRKDEKFIIIFPGTLNWHQGVDIAIRAFDWIKDQIPNAEFHIYGEGQAKPDLIQLVNELGLQNKVLLWDAVSLLEAAQQMENSDLGVVPKRSNSFGNEAFSTKILEFMALGVPVIVSDTKIDRFYFNDSVVKFFRSGEQKDLADAILLLYKDVSLRRRLVENGAAFVQKNNWETKKNEYLQLVDSLVAQEGGKRIP